LDDQKQTAFQHSNEHNKFFVYIIVVETTGKILLPSSVFYCKFIVRVAEASQ